MGLIDYIKRRLGLGPMLPLLLRARVEKIPVDAVEVDATWQPSGTRATYRAKHAQGLCAVPWVAGERRVVLVVRSEGREATLTVDGTTAREGLVIEVALDA